jgi:hypothetical protein
MSKQNVYVVLACMHSVIKDYVNVQFFEHEDAIALGNNYLFPHTDVEIEENEMFPEKSRWRFSTPENNWHPFGHFVSISPTEAATVVSKLSYWENSTERPVSSFLKAHEGAERWKNRERIILPTPRTLEALHR